MGPLSRNATLLDSNFDSNLFSKRLSRGCVFLVGAKLPEVFKDTDADFNLGVAIGAARMVRNDPEKAFVRICFHGELFEPHQVTREANGDFTYCI